MPSFDYLQTVEASPLTAREVGVVEDANFWEPYKDELHKVFGALDREDQWSDDPEVLLEYMEPGWLGGEHGNSVDKDQFTPGQIAAAWPIIDGMGFCRRIVPPEKITVNDALVVGAGDPSNHDRAEEFRRAREELRIQTPSVRLLMGERQRGAVDGSIEEIIDRALALHPHAATATSWIKRQLAIARGELPGTAFATETDLGRLVIGRLGAAGALPAPHRIDLPITDLRDPHARPQESIAYTENGVQKRTPSRAVMDRHFVASDGLAITLMNAAASARERGAPRHTSTSCTAEWVDRYPLPQDGTALVVVNQPYGTRMIQDMRYELSAAGRSDIRLVPAVAAMRPNMSIHSALGTFASLIRLDLRRKQRKG